MRDFWSRRTSASRVAIAFKELARRLAVRASSCPARWRYLQQCMSLAALRIVDLRHEPSFLPHVFDRLEQADSTMTRRHGGLVLGLAIVKQLVEAHGGNVQAKSPGVGKGSTFVVSLPVAIVYEDCAVVSVLCKKQRQTETTAIRERTDRQR